MAGCDVQRGDVFSLLTQEERYDTCNRYDPDEGTDQPGPGCCPPGKRVHRIHHSQEPVHTDAGHEQDGAVHVTVKCRSDKSAHSGSKEPVIPRESVNYVERKYTDKQHICGGEVQHVHHRRFPDFHLKQEYDDRHYIQR